jgi:hypothetical protein
MKTANYSLSFFFSTILTIFSLKKKMTYSFAIDWSSDENKIDMKMWLFARRCVINLKIMILT